MGWVVRRGGCVGRSGVCRAGGDKHQEQAKGCESAGVTDLFNYNQCPRSRPSSPSRPLCLWTSALAYFAHGYLPTPPTHTLSCSTTDARLQRVISGGVVAASWEKSA